MKRIHKITALIMCFIVLICTLGISFNVSAVTMYNRNGYINDAGVNIRRGAGTNNESIGQLENNTKVLVNGVGFDANGTRWYSLVAYTSSGNLSGFVHSNYVTITGSDKTYEAKTVKNATIRSAPGTWNDAVATLPIGTKVTAIGTEDDSDGDMWYHITFVLNGELKSGYAYQTNVEVLAEYIEDADFEKKLTDEGFPESYKPYLRNLHSLYPNWQFKADILDITFEQAVKGETAFGRSAVASSKPEAWKSMAQDCYNWSTKTYNTIDSGGWVQASDSVVKYYLDPRNFLNTTGVFQFISMEYDEKLHTKERVQTALEGTFLAKDFPEDTYDTYADVLIAAAKDSGVSPISLASMILVEQGNSGTGKSISGTVSGYVGYYNFYNIRAYRSGNYSAVQYGLLYAKGGDGSRKDYYRPWKTRKDSIIGGAVWYAEQYLSRGQDTLYYKKFNVVSKPYFAHEYMTNIEGAASEAKKTAQGYKLIMDSALIFNIPVYKNMPSNAIAYPATTGNNDCYLSGLTVDNYKFTPTFDRYKNEYEFIVDSTDSQVVITAYASNTGSKVTGDGVKDLKYGSNQFTVTVTSTSGVKNDYNIYIYREEPENTQFEFDLAVYTAQGNFVKGIKPLTSQQTLISNFRIVNGTAKITKFDKTSEYIGTGDIIELFDNSSNLKYTFTLVVEADINGDGKCNTTDLADMKLFLANINKLSESAKYGADINDDGNVTTTDLAVLKLKLVGIN